MANQQFNNILKDEKLQEIRVGLKVIIFVLAILVCLQQIEIFNVARKVKGISAMGTFFSSAAFLPLKYRHNVDYPLLS